MIEIIVKDTGDDGVNRFKASLKPEKLQLLIDTYYNIHFGTYGYNKKSARNRMVKFLKTIRKHVIRFADELDEFLKENK